MKWHHNFKILLTEVSDFDYSGWQCLDFWCLVKLVSFPLSSLWWWQWVDGWQEPGVFSSSWQGPGMWQNPSVPLWSTQLLPLSLWYCWMDGSWPGCFHFLPSRGWGGNGNLQTSCCPSNQYPPPSIWSFPPPTSLPSHPPLTQSWWVKPGAKRTFSPAQCAVVIGATYGTNPSDLFLLFGHNSYLP